MKILFIAAHPDDETLGCAGTILKYKKGKADIYWLIATKGFSPVYSDRILLKKRQEVEEINKFYGFEKYYWLDFHTTKLDKYPRFEIIEEFYKVLKQINPDIIYSVGEADVHSDHKLVFESLMSTLKSFKRNFKCKKIYVYETPSSTDATSSRDKIFLPTSFVDTTNFIDKKLKAIKIYKTERQAYPLPRNIHSVKALAKYRGATIGVGYAEAFMLVREIR